MLLFTGFLHQVYRTSSSIMGWITSHSQAAREKKLERIARCGLSYID